MNLQKKQSMYMAQMCRYLSHDLKMIVINISEEIDKMGNFTRELKSVVKNKIILELKMQ